VRIPENGDAPVALITGASRGIGAATARRLAVDGFRVVLAARRAEALSLLAGDLLAMGSETLVVPTDLSDLSAIDALLDTTRDWAGHIDALVNNAGVLPPAVRGERMPIEEWQSTLLLNVTAPWYLATRARPLMDAGAVVVNISSSAAYYPSIGLSAYNVSKAALNMVTRCLALEWAADGIRVVGIAPGKVDTELVVPVMEWVERTQQSTNPMGRLGTPEEVADLVAYLAASRAGYVTGSIFAIDGGELLTASAELPR
jgi:NAD(P)-dependent dehydrogenase (short-subunit alcohol dehydrogenase family)